MPGHGPPPGQPKNRRCHVRRPRCLSSCTHIDCYVSFSTIEGTGSRCTANTAARVLLRLVTLFTHPTQNGKLLSGQRPEGSATIDPPRHHPPVDVGGRHRSITNAAQDDHPVRVSVFVVPFGVTPLREVPVVMITPRHTTTIATFDLPAVRPHTNVPLPPHASI